MMEKWTKSQKGAISVFVMIAMLFFLVTIMGIYTIASKRAQVQTQMLEGTQEKYYQEGEEEAKIASKRADANAVIPIYTDEQFGAIGTGVDWEIEGKIYTFSADAKYQLQNDIVVNITTELDKMNFESYHTSYTIDKNNYGISYYYNNEYYTLLRYSGQTIASGSVQLTVSSSGIVKDDLYFSDSEEYCKLGYAKPHYGTTLSTYSNLFSNFDPASPIQKTSSVDNYWHGNYGNAWSFWYDKISTNYPIINADFLSNQLTPITMGSNVNTFTETVRNDWIVALFRAGAYTTSVYLSQLNLKFSDNTTKTIQQAVDSGYIEPLVIYSSAASNDAYTWKNIQNIITGGQTDTVSYPSVLIFLKVTNKSSLTGLSFYTNKEWGAPSDGFLVRLLKNVELSTEPFTTP